MIALIILLIITNILILLLKFNYYINLKFFKSLLYLELFTGLSFVIYPTYFLNFHVGLLMIILSSVLLSNFEKPSNPILIKPNLINKFTNNKKLSKYFPLVGFLILVFQFFSSFFLFNKYIGNIDLVVVLVGLSWSSFLIIPNSFYKERDFFFTFINLLAFFLILPVVFQILISGYSNSYSSSKLIEFFLVIPLKSVLILLGYTVSHNLDSLSYQDLEANITQTVFIAQSCSGFYSVIIFISAFTSYILIERNKLDIFFLNLLMVGIIISYISNLIRMTLIILAGHYYGIEALFWTHDNIGWVIFSLWIAIFWFVANKYFIKAI